MEEYRVAQSASSLPHGLERLSRRDIALQHIELRPAALPKWLRHCLRLLIPRSVSVRQALTVQALPQKTMFQLRFRFLRGGRHPGGGRAG